MPTEIPLKDIDQPEPLSCSTCEACCCRLQVLVTDDYGIPHHLLEEDSWGGLVMRQEEDGWCAALDRNSMLCTIYSRRPQLCRDFALGGDDCLEERSQQANLYLEQDPKI